MTSMQWAACCVKAAVLHNSKNSPTWLEGVLWHDSSCRIKSRKNENGMKHLLALGLMAAMWAVSGCALTVRDTPVDYKFTKAPAADFSGSPEKIRVGKFADSRGMDNPRMLMHSQNMYGNTMSGGSQAEEPVAEIVRDGVVQGLTAAHARVVEDGPSLILSGDLMEYSYSVVQGLWAGTVNTKLLVKVKLSSQSGHTIWSDTLLGKASYHGAMNPGDVVLFQLTLDDFVMELQKNEDFQRALHVQ
jgi:hypothetical protein